MNNVENRHTIVVEVFSTITSPVFSELVIVLMDHEIPNLPSDPTFFEMLREMNELRPFKLVFSFDSLVFPGHMERAQRRLAEALDQVNAEGLLNFLDSPFTIR